MKFLLAALIAALSSCVTPAAPPACDVRIPEVVKEQVALGRVAVAVTQLPPAAILIILHGMLTGKDYGILVAYPGSLVPAPESPFNFAELCTAEGGIGRIYFAEFEGGPKL